MKQSQSILKKQGQILERIRDTENDLQSSDLMRMGDDIKNLLDSDIRILNDLDKLKKDGEKLLSIEFVKKLPATLIKKIIHLLTLEQIKNIPDANLDLLNNDELSKQSETTKPDGTEGAGAFDNSVIKKRTNSCYY